MKHTWILAVVAAGALLSPARAEFPRGKRAPAFNLRRLDGSPLSFAALRGKVVFLDFWGPS